METTNKAAANAMATPATPATKTSLEIIEAMQVNIQTTLGGTIMENVKKEAANAMVSIKKEEAVKMKKSEILRSNTVAEATKAATLIATFSLTIYHNTNNVITGVSKEQHLETLTTIYKNLVSMCDGNIDMKIDGIS